MNAREATAGQAGARRDPEALWAAAARLIDRAPTLDALRAHRIQFLALALRRAQGRAIPAGLLEEARAAAMMTVGAEAVLKRARAAYDGGLMLMKGAEVAASYPDPSARYFRDVDLVAEDAPAAQRALLDAGFTEVEATHDFSEDDHLRPLVFPGLPLLVEVHRQPSSPTYLNSPTAADVLALTVASATGVDGLLAPEPAVHAVLLVAHSWTHLPLGRLGDLLDVAAVLPADARAEARALARRWGWERMWLTTLSAIDALLDESPPTRPLQTWARHLTEVREPTIFETHLARLAAPVAALPPARAARGFGGALWDLLAPSPDERWGTKLSRATRALLSPSQTKSQHDRLVGRNPWSR